MRAVILQLRVALKNKVGYSISIFSLILGFSVCLLVYRFVQLESAYDKAHSDYQKLYRIILHYAPEGVDLGDAVVQFPVAAQMQSDIAGIESTLRIHREPDFPLLQYLDNKFVETNQLFVDQNFFSFLAFPLIKGDAESALIQPNSIILTPKTAARYFGEEDPMGKTLLYQGKYSLAVTGIVDDSKIQSHVKFDMLIPMEFYFNLLKEQGNEAMINSWFTTRPWTYLKFKDDASKDAANNMLATFVDKHFPATFKAHVTLELQPIIQIHTGSNYVSEIEPNVSDSYLIIFLIIIITILAFSAINFLNLNTAMVLNRAKEFSVKGFLGSSRIDLFIEIFTSTFRIALVSLVLAILITYFIQPIFNSFMDVNIPMISPEKDWKLLLLSLVVVVAVSFLGTLQPFLVVGSGKHLNTISDKRGVSKMVRQLVVGIQIACSFILVFGSLVIFSQMNFLNNFNLGFDKENVIVLPFSQSIVDHFEAFKNEVKKIDGVQHVTWGADVPGLGGVTNYRFVPEGANSNEPLFIPFVQVDYDFVETMNIKMKDGREFDPSIPGDSAHAYIVNQSLLKTLGWETNYLGKELRMYRPGTSSLEQGFRGKIVGTFYDFHMESLHFPDKPMILALKHTYTHAGSFLVKTTGDNQKVLAQLNSVWGDFENEWPFQYKLLSNELYRLYQNEDKLFSLSMTLSVLAIVISLVGLFGMNSIAIVKEFKAIAIKKVLGAHANNISLEILKKEFIFLLIIFVLAVPVSYIIFIQWLKSFENRIQISPLIMLSSILIITLLVFGTIAYHLIKMRNTNPLKYIQRGN